MNDLEQFLAELGIEPTGEFGELEENLLLESEDIEDTNSNSKDDEYLNDLLRSYNPEYTPGRKQTYVIDLKDSTEFAKVYTKLDKSDLVAEDTESSLITDNNTSIQYVSDKYTVSLLGNFEDDTYKLTIREN